MINYDVVSDKLLGMGIIHSVVIGYKPKRDIKCTKQRRRECIPRFDYSHDDPECNLPIYNLALPHETPNPVIKENQKFKVYCPSCEKYFWTTIRKHLDEGYGCPTCPKKYQEDKQSGSRYRASKTREFRLKAIRIHGNINEYTISYYTSCIDDIFIRCSIHGIITTTPQVHVLKKCGCRKCGDKRVSEFRLNDTKYFIHKSILVHGDRYDYSKAIYTGYHDYLTIICPEHGEFRQRAGIHMLGCTCPYCNYSNRFDVPTHPNRFDVVSYDKFSDKVLITDSPTRGDYGELLVVCKKCNRLHPPNKRDMYHRIGAINGHNGRGGESSFYCSDECKLGCEVYGVNSLHHEVIVPSSELARRKMARNCQSKSKRTLLQIQRDEYGYNYCDKCGSTIDKLEIHHTIEVAKDPIGAINPAGHMIVCEICHKQFTKRCR